jgi:hypothetical protein
MLQKTELIFDFRNLVLTILMYNLNDKSISDVVIMIFQISESMMSYIQTPVILKF